MRRLLAKFLIPHQENDHFPHSIRPNFLLFYIAAILTVQLVYNFMVTGEVRVLSFATNINQSEIIQLTNIQRQAAGVGAVTENALLDQAAAKKAADMFANDYWAHVSPTGTTPWYFYDQVGYKYIYAGENLARDFDTSAGVVDGWINSPSHKDNMLSPNYTDIGVAVVNGFLLGHETTLVVQLFGRPQFVPVASAQPSATPGQSTQPSQSRTPKPQPSSVEHEVGTQPSGSQLAQNPTPVTSNPYVASPQVEKDVPYQPTVLSLERLSGGQKLMLAILIPVLAFFLFDAVMLLRSKKIVVRGHSLVHATIVGMIILVIIGGSFGVLR